MQIFKHKIFFFALGSSLAYFTNAHSKNIEPPFYVSGIVTTLIKTDEILPNGIPLPKEITLLKVTPSKLFIDEKNKLVLTKESDYSHGIIAFSKMTGAVDLGMNNTPVLDQGKYGTCVTFATTAAIDAILGFGDFISQQCSLELAKSLGNDIWYGAYYPSEVIDPLKKYGVVQKDKCNLPYGDPSATITIEEYQTRSNKKININAINYKYNNMTKLDVIKASLNAKHRVVISFGLNTTNDPISVQGFNMHIDGQITTGGLWACKLSPTSKTDYCGIPNAGHEVIIIGYDDIQQLLKIRNSWNTSVGDDGNFYMTYQFFERMVGDSTEIYSIGQSF